MNNSKNKEIAQEYARRIWTERDLKAIDDLFHPKVLIHSLLGDFHGLEPLRKIVNTWLKGFPDLAVKNTSVIGEHDLVVIQWEVKGTHLGEFQGVKPTKKPVSYTGVTIYRIHEGKITEYWAYLDMQHILKQIS